MSEKAPLPVKRKLRISWRTMAFMTIASTGSIAHTSPALYAAALLTGVGVLLLSGQIIYQLRRPSWLVEAAGRDLSELDGEA